MPYMRHEKALCERGVLFILGYDNDTGKVYPFHLYHKTSGKKPKTDLTPKEKEEIKKMVNES